MLASASGEEARGDQAQKWFQKAIELSGPEGPVQTLFFKKAVSNLSGRRYHGEKLDLSLRQAEIPTFVYARTAHRQITDMILGQAHCNQDVSDRRVRFPVSALSGARGSVELTGDMTVALDITAVLTLSHLGILRQVIDHFHHIVLASRTLGLLFAERQFLRVQQPSQIAKASRLQVLISSGQLKLLRRLGRKRTPAGKEIGEDLVALLEAARANGLVVRSAPVMKLGSYLEESADMGAYSDELTDMLSVLSFLSNEGKIDAETTRKAARYLHQVDRGWSSAHRIEASSTLYLDDLAVTYLDFVELFEPLTRAVDAVYVDEGVKETSTQTIRFGEQVNHLLDEIESIRSALVYGIESGRIIFSARHFPEQEGKDEEEDMFASAPTLDLLSDLTGIDAVVTDDRFLNKLPAWTDGTKHSASAASTIDVLAELRRTGKFDEGTYWAARDKLRRSGFYAMPLEVNELVYHVTAAAIDNLHLRESPELWAIRESIAMPILNNAFVIAETPWLTNMRFVILKAIHQV
ncbi:hypothetical protein [Breoghania sp.]|uniref:hypothetical protein n=1 Tax=Breoghania sp. TaxID=2065378 RepID=UPI00261E19CC|nr:hypothetical protein [Breoghania sp.]MDJ0931295.1 hypothetical protein [Breoghania sp.]